MMNELFMKDYTIKKINEKGVKKAYYDLKNFIEDNRDKIEHMTIKEYGKDNAGELTLRMDADTKLKFLSTALLNKKITDEEIEFIGQQIIEVGREIIGD